MTEAGKYDVFVSYSEKDRSWASALVDALKGEGVRAWYDQDSMTPGDQWETQITEALRDSRVIVLLVTPDYVSRAWTSFELGAAVADNKKIIPIVAKNIERSQIPSHLQGLSMIEESSPRLAGKRVAELAKAKRRAQ